MKIKIAVVGCGAAGGVFAGLLSLSGNDVFAVEHDELHASAINEKGLILNGSKRKRKIFFPVLKIGTSEPVDLLILAVKAADLADAARQSIPMLGRNTMVATIQDELESAKVVTETMGTSKIAIGNISEFNASRRAPGNIQYDSLRPINFKGHGNFSHERINSLVHLLQAAGFDAKAVRDI